jgi:hypothetical protein
LVEGLKLINQQSNLEPKPLEIATVQPSVTASAKIKTDYLSAPEQIQRIVNDKNSEYAQARQLFEKIRLMDSREHRLQAGLQLLDLMDSVNEKWSLLDEWRDKGNIREQQMEETGKSVDELSIAELMKESKNLPTYISKDKKRLDGKLVDAKKVKICARLEINIKRLELVNKRLEGLK